MCYLECTAASMRRITKTILVGVITPTAVMIGF